MNNKILMPLALFLIVVGIALASVPLFQGRFEVESIDGSTNTGWRVGGKFDDSSLLGFSASDCTTGDLVYCYSSMGDIDEFLVTNVVSVSGVNLTVDVVYNEFGVLRAGAPEAGDQIICRQSINGTVYLPSITFGKYSEYLQTGARSLNLKRKYGRKQVLDNNATIDPWSNVEISTTNTLVTLGNPQVATNNIEEGTVISLHGAATTGDIQFYDGNGLSLNCGASFLMGATDVLKFMFLNSSWLEVKRIDK